jgi:hypothetical protein
MIFDTTKRVWLSSVFCFWRRVCLGVHNDKIESSEGEADEEVDDVGTLTELFMEEVCESEPKAQVKQK